MDTAELNILNVLIEKLHLTDEEKINFTEDFEKVRENCLKSSKEDFKSLFEEGFHRIELKLEQQNTNFEQFNEKLDKHRWEIIKLFITIVLMILGLYATVIFNR